jgi:hypothetical protein
MSASAVQICNLALSRIGSTQAITSITGTGLPVSAQQCQLWYDQTRVAMLSDFPYPFAEAYFVLNEVEGPETSQTRANAQWLRSYRYPSDCLKLRQVIQTPPPIVASGIPQTTGSPGINFLCNEYWRRAIGNAYPVSYGMGNDANGQLIMSDFYGAQGLTAIYTQDVTDPTKFDADFVDAFAWRLGGELAMALGYDNAKREMCLKMAERSVYRARVTQMNQIQSDGPYLRRQSEVIRARWGG